MRKYLSLELIIGYILGLTTMLWIKCLVKVAHWLKGLRNLDFEVKVGLFILALVAVIASVRLKRKRDSWLLNKEYEEIMGGKK